MNISWLFFSDQQADVKNEEENKMEEKEEELRKVLQSAVTLCVNSGFLTAEKAHKYHRSGESMCFNLLTHAVPSMGRDGC